MPRRRSDALIKLWKAPAQTITVSGASHNHFHSPEYYAAVAKFLDGEAEAKAEAEAAGE